MTDHVRPATLAAMPTQVAQDNDHAHDWGGFDRSICPACNGMHTYCTICGASPCVG